MAKRARELNDKLPVIYMTGGDAHEWARAKRRARREAICSGANSDGGIAATKRGGALGSGSRGGMNDLPGSPPISQMLRQTLPRAKPRAGTSNGELSLIASPIDVRLRSC